ncbi:hypothetical protein STEG23_000095 [Scotinomys teguina]
MKVKEQLVECEQVFANAETNESLKGDQDEGREPGPRRRLAVQDEDLESLCDASDEEQLEREIKELQQRLQKTKQQIAYDPGTYAQIANAAGQAWKSLPNIAPGEQISKVLQGPSEPYADFVSWFLQLAGKIFGDSDQAMTVVKQLAYENANKYCKRRP